VIQGIAGAGIGLLVGLLARPFLEAYVAHRVFRDAVVERSLEEADHAVTL